MLKNQLDALNADVNRRERNSVLRKLLPFLLVLSFMWVGLFENYSQTSFEIADYFKFGMAEKFSELFFMNLLFGALIDWLWFEIIFYVYRLFLGFSVFSYTIPVELLKNKAKLFMVIRNLIFGVFSSLMFFVPQFVGTYIIVIELLVDVLIFLWFAFSAMKETVDPMIKPNVFRVLTIWFFIMRLFDVISHVWGVI